MTPLIPKKLQPGDEIRVIAPARSLSMKFLQNEELKAIAQERFDQLGLKLTFAKHVYEIDDFSSSSIQSRVEDLHEAFSDPKIKALITVIGGFNTNQLLSYLDYELIKNNPKILVGYSDITALQHSIFAKTGLVTYSGPHYFSFGNKLGFDYSLEYFKKCLMNSDPFEIIPSETWINDLWIGKQDDRNFSHNEGFWNIQNGKAKGRIMGANLCTLNLLQGTEFFPRFETDTILFLEDDEDSHPAVFDRDLQSLIHQPGFEYVKGMVIGRFETASKMTRSLLSQIISSKKELKHIPVIANVDFGHTNPQITFPIGGSAEMNATELNLKIIQH